MKKILKESDVYQPLAILKNVPVIDGLRLSAIGARICYSDEHPIRMITTDKRITDESERAKFLSRLAKAKHYSVFAHSPLFTRTSVLHQPPFKLFYAINDNGEFTICANARHVVPYLDDDELETYLNLQCQNYNYAIKEIIATPDYVKNFQEVVNDKKLPEKGLIVFAYTENEWEWYSCISFGYSVIYSHQHVRHTFQNFSQRSHRYTRVDDIVVPDTIKQNPGYDYALQHVDNSIMLYNKLVDTGVPKEDARFIVPSGRTTVLMFSGPRFVMEDFISKRTIKAAQWEIREVAQLLRNVIDYLDK